MLILFDHSVPAPLRDHLKKHAVTEAVDRGWDRLSNGDLLTVAEVAGFDVLLTADNNLLYQQNLKKRRIASCSHRQPVAHDPANDPKDCCGG